MRDWRVVANKRTGAIFIRDFASKKEVVATVLNGLDDKEDAKVAFMVAAAPELLAKLKEVSEECFDYSSIPRERRRKNEIDELIAKAEGRS